MQSYVLEFALAMLILLLALGVALALIVTGAFCVIWAITRGYLVIQKTPWHPSAQQAPSSPQEGARHHRDVVALSSKRPRYPQ
jgi:hypothetical protein